MTISFSQLTIKALYGVLPLIILLSSQQSLAATVDPFVDRALDGVQQPIQFDRFSFAVNPASHNIIQAGESCSNPVDAVVWQEQKIYEMQIAGALFANQSLNRISTLLTDIRVNMSKPRGVIPRKPTFARCQGGCCYPCDARSRCSSSRSCSSYRL